MRQKGNDRYLRENKNNTNKVDSILKDKWSEYQGTCKKGDSKCNFTVKEFFSSATVYVLNSC